MSREGEIMGKAEETNCNIIHKDVVDEVLAKMPKNATFQKSSDFFKVLGDETRTKIIWALDQHEMCVCDIASVLGMTKSAISHQLATLKKARLVKNRREGKVIYYSLADDHVKLMLESGIEHTTHED